jgi:NTE family protein
MGGGGIVGVAWETGVVAGLLEEGVDLRRVDAIVGTSAGSMVGARIAAGQDLREPPPVRPGAPEAATPEAGPDLGRLREIFSIWSKASTVTDQMCREIGSLALAAKCTSEARWIAATGGSLGIDDWPETALRLAVVEAATGRFRSLSAADRVPLAAAIAASCAVPGMFPPISLAGSRYLDGGVRSGTSADLLLADAPEQVLVVAPMSGALPGIGALAERCLRDEVAQLEGGGSRVVAVLPDASDLEAFGGNLMDPSRATPARAAGASRGRALARTALADWADAA